VQDAPENRPSGVKIFLMSKELIVSVNGREKKIAIIEDGKVTEFYIERGEDGQGIVGNIYKGRVMRVLPGMQSAFVDIGLERDAFLYVSDFFDEEEEFERIVIDKKKTEGADAATAARDAADKLERARLERERAMDTAQERAQPVLAGDDEDEDEATQIEPRIATLSESIPPTALENSASRDEAPAETRGGSSDNERGRRDRKRRGGRENYEREVGAAASAAGSSSAISTPPLTSSFSEDVQARLAARQEEINTPFVVADSSFERVVDDEAAVTNGEMFKDARLQERLTDQIHAVEFDMEMTGEAEVGSLLSAENMSGGGSFERIADDDDERDAPRAIETVQPAVAATVSAFIDDNAEDSALTPNQPQSFERVSDEDKAVEGATTMSSTGDEEETSLRGGRASKSRRGSSKSKKAAGDTTT
jgi:hypothetical protein